MRKVREQANDEYRTETHKLHKQLEGYEKEIEAISKLNSQLMNAISKSKKGGRRIKSKKSKKNKKMKRKTHRRRH